MAQSLPDRAPAARPIDRLRRIGGELVNPRWGGPAVLVLSAASLGYASVAEGYGVFVLAIAAITVTVGVGLNFLLGLSGLISLGHVGFYLIGAYATGILLQAGLPFWLAFLASGLIAALAGIAVALPALRVSGPYLAMVTIAFAFIVQHGTIEWKSLTGGSSGLMGFARPELLGVTLAEREIAVLAIVLATAALLIFHAVGRGTLGQAMRAVRDSEIAARSIGLNPTAVKTTSFAISAAFTGLAGALFTPLQMFISPGSFPFTQSLLFVLGVMVGGAGTLFGPVIGALVVVMPPELFAGLAEYRLLAFGSLLLVVLWAAPRGVIGALVGALRRESERSDDAAREAVPRILQDSARATTAAPALEVDNVSIAFGGVQAASEVSFQATPGTITSLIGPNGAGKTTVLNMIGGFYTPDSGCVRLGEEVVQSSPVAVARAGIARTYQTSLLFDEMTVADNLKVAATRGRLTGSAGGRSAWLSQEAVKELLSFVGYTGPLDRLAGALPHGDKRLVEIARALAMRPRVLLLDEPAAGLTSGGKRDLADLLKRISRTNIAVILVEHDMSLIMGISDSVLVLDAGTQLMQGTPAEVQNDQRVKEAYLGSRDYEGRPRPEPWQGERMAVLTTKDLTADYGAAPVVQDLNLVVNPGEMVAMLGANGAGKTTSLRAMAGLHRPVGGSILVDDWETRTWGPPRVVSAGLTLVPEGRQVFPELTVRDNILLGAYSRRDLDPQQELEQLLQRFPVLRMKMSTRAGLLSGGEQQMLAIARGLIARPKIILLDEPSLGLAPAMIAQLYEALADLRDEGVTVLVVDQMATLALAVSDRGYVLESGRVAGEGDAASLRDDPAIEQAYLGQMAESRK